MKIAFSIVIISLANLFQAQDSKLAENYFLDGNYSAALIRHNNHIYAFSEDGRGVVFTTGREFKLISENKLPGGFMSSPAVSGNSLYLRTRTHLYRVDAG